MKLWILKARDEELPDDDNPWKPWFDKTFKFVVRAKTEEAARIIAHENAGDETRTYNLALVPAIPFDAPWLHSKYSVCQPLMNRGAAGVLIHDCYSA